MSLAYLRWLRANSHCNDCGEIHHCFASCDTHPKGRDAVAKPDAPTLLMADSREKVALEILEEMFDELDKLNLPITKQAHEIMERAKSKLAALNPNPSVSTNRRTPV